MVILSEKGRVYERGLRPLSTEHPSPAMMTLELPSMVLAGEGQG